MKFAFIVEGHLESEFLGNICKGSEVRRLRINGRDVSIQQICNVIYPHVVFLRRKSDKVVIIVDREQRDISADNMKLQISANLLDRGIAPEGIFVAVPDRNIESWILPFLNEKCDLGEDATESYDGRNGKSIMSSRFKRTGRNYVEPIDGVKYLKDVKPSILSEVSESFADLYSILRGNCWWAEK